MAASLADSSVDIGSGVGGKGSIGGCVDGGVALRENDGRFFWLRDGSAGATNVFEGVLVLSSRDGTSWLVESANF